MKSPTWRPVSPPNVRPPARSSSKIDDRTVGERIQLRAGVDQAGAGDDWLVLERVEQPVALDARCSTAHPPVQLDAREAARS